MLAICFKQVVALEMVIRIAGAIEVDLYRFRIEVSAILEFNSGTQFDGVGQAVGAGLIALSQHVSELHLFIKAKQALIEGFRDSLRQRVVGVIGIESGEVGRDGNHRILCCPGGQCHCAA
ncbi:Uncharacterised protein [Pantoea agglomerans]|uniref:Uncharacterized protein n=1 Tax=Enterobacter agglomerans TaxID=549 RepID=A0A379AIK6_ENTAG|nr:Uncharacterised protein [Pantoea agglomerans]